MKASNEEIMKLLGELFVYPMHYLRAGLKACSIPENPKTVGELRDEIDTFHTNQKILSEVVEDIMLLSSVESVRKGEETVEEIYERSNKINPANIKAKWQKAQYMIEEDVCRRVRNFVMN